MLNITKALINDEFGFIVSGELVLVATIAVLALVVGLSEVSLAVNQELEDVASAFGSMNQSFEFDGLEGHQGESAGSRFRDDHDFCDSEQDLVPVGAHDERQKRFNNKRF